MPLPGGLWEWITTGCRTVLGDSEPAGEGRVAGSWQ